MLDEIDALPAENRAAAVCAVNDGASPSDWARYAETREATITIRYPVDTPELAHVSDHAMRARLHEDALESLAEEMRENWPGASVDVRHTEAG